MYGRELTKRDGGFGTGGVVGGLGAHFCLIAYTWLLALLPVLQRFLLRFLAMLKANYTNNHKLKISNKFSDDGFSLYNLPNPFS